MSIIENCRNELVEEKYIQSESQLIKETEVHHETVNTLMANVLSYIANKSN